MLEIKNTDREIKAAFDVLIMRPNMAEGRTDKLEERSIHNSKIKAKRKKNRASENYGTILSFIIYHWYTRFRIKGEQSRRNI